MKRKEKRKANHFPIDVKSLYFIFLRRNLVGQLVNWHGDLFISAKKESK